MTTTGLVAMLATRSFIPIIDHRKCLHIKSHQKDIKPNSEALPNYGVEIIDKNRKATYCMKI